MQHQRELAEVEKAARAREMQRMENEMQRLRQEAAKPTASPASAAVDQDVMRKLQQAMDDQNRRAEEREAALRRRLSEVGNPVRRGCDASSLPD